MLPTYPITQQSPHEKNKIHRILEKRNLTKVGHSDQSMR